MGNSPCKVILVKNIHPGKHGSKKHLIECIDIFTGKIYNHIYNMKEKVQVPHITRLEYKLDNIEIDGNSLILSLSNTDGTSIDDIKLPDSSTDLTDICRKQQNKLAEEIKQQFDDNKNIFVTVINTMDRNQIISFKVV